LKSVLFYSLSFLALVSMTVSRDAPHAGAPRPARAPARARARGDARAARE
jgi:hypothetical protein